MRVVAALMIVAGLVTPGLKTRLHAEEARRHAEAHEKFKIVGTVTKVLKEELVVKAVDGATYEMDFFESAPIFLKNKKVARAELKPGVKVTVNALGHDMFDLEVVEVHIAN
jgi:hypothetical protein